MGLGGKGRKEKKTEAQVSYVNGLLTEHRCDGILGRGREKNITGV